MAHTSRFRLCGELKLRDADVSQRGGPERGTERVRSDVNGESFETCSNLPYGDAQTCTGSLEASPLHFTGKQRDTETGLDYFNARYYASTSGRFMLPDWSAVPEAMPYADLSNPQSFNRYVYLNDNPLSGIDADGHHNANAPGCGIGSGVTMPTTSRFTPPPTEIKGNCPAPPPDPPQAPTPPPMATLHTSIKGGYTELEWTDKKGGFHDDKIRSLVKADSKSKRGAGGPFKSYVVGQIRGLSSPAYGPEGAQINTGDSPRGRWIHGGGTSLGIHAYDPHQRLTPTYGCTRACNADVQRLGREITNFQNANPNDPTPIIYTRTEQ